jgi:hypothetical protein
MNSKKLLIVHKIRVFNWYREERKSRKKRKKKYLIDIGKCKWIYCEIFFIGKQKIVLFPKYMKNS